MKMCEGIKIVADTLDEPELLCQLAEEASELSTAALKLRRAITKINPTPKSEEECRDNLAEELADVSLCLDVLGIDTTDRALMLTMVKTVNRKCQRWVKRLEEVHGTPDV